MTINGNDWDQRPLALAPAMALTLAPPTLVPAMALALVPVPLDPSQDHDCHFSCIFIEVSVTIPVPGYIVRYGIPGRFYWDSSRIPVGTQADSSRIQAGFQWCDICKIVHKIPKRGVLKLHFSTVKRDRL